MSGMGMPGANAPDTFGLPEYPVSEALFEIDGANVRIVCGSKRFGEVHWHYIALLKAEDLLLLAEECRRAAQESFNAVQLMDRRVAN